MSEVHYPQQPVGGRLSSLVAHFPRLTPSTLQHGLQLVGDVPRQLWFVGHDAISCLTLRDEFLCCCRIRMNQCWTVRPRKTGDKQSVWKHPYFTDRRSVYHEAELQVRSISPHCWLPFPFRLALPSEVRRKIKHKLFLVFKVYFLFFRKQENIFFFFTQENKYTILLYEQNAQFTKVAQSPTRSTHFPHSYDCSLVFSSLTLKFLLQ